MRRKNYITIFDPINVGLDPIDVPPTVSPSSTDTTNNKGNDTTNNKGNFWETLGKIAGVAGGLFSNKQPQQTNIPPQNPPKDNPNYGLIIGIIVAVIVVGVAIYFMTRK